ncbi:MAG: hypothetical protein U9Q63_03185, partial [Patescibacteria group bacterium]|nr:hypothetical protein [Patescibacteria group bacterium]
IKLDTESDFFAIEFMADEVTEDGFSPQIKIEPVVEDLRVAYENGETKLISQTDNIYYWETNSKQWVKANGQGLILEQGMKITLGDWMFNQPSEESRNNPIVPIFTVVKDKNGGGYLYREGGMLDQILSLGEVKEVGGFKTWHNIVNRGRIWLAELLVKNRDLSKRSDLVKTLIDLGYPIGQIDLDIVNKIAVNQVFDKGYDDTFETRQNYSVEKLFGNRQVTSFKLWFDEDKPVKPYLSYSDEIWQELDEGQVVKGSCLLDGNATTFLARRENGQIEIVVIEGEEFTESEQVVEMDKKQKKEVEMDEVFVDGKWVEEHPKIGTHFSHGSQGEIYLSKDGEEVIKIFNPHMDAKNKEYAKRQIEIYKKSDGANGLISKYLGEIYNAKGQLIGWRQEYISSAQNLGDFSKQGGRLSYTESIKALVDLISLFEITDYAHSDLYDIAFSSNLHIVPSGESQTKHRVVFMDYAGYILSNTTKEEQKQLLINELNYLFKRLFGVEGKAYVDEEALGKKQEVIKLLLDKDPLLAIKQYYQKIKKLEKVEEAGKEIVVSGAKWKKNLKINRLTGGIGGLRRYIPRIPFLQANIVQLYFDTDKNIVGVEKVSFFGKVTINDQEIKRKVKIALVDGDKLSLIGGLKEKETKFEVRVDIDKSMLSIFNLKNNKPIKCGVATYLWLSSPEMKVMEMEEEEKPEGFEIMDRSSLPELPEDDWLEEIGRLVKEEEVSQEPKLIGLPEGVGEDQYEFLRGIVDGAVSDGGVIIL